MRVTRRFCALSQQLPEMVVHNWKPLLTTHSDLLIGKQFDSTILDPSVIPTKYLQRSLLRLPIPKLADTCRRYLDIVKPLVSAKRFHQTAAIVSRFQHAAGQNLQHALIQRDRQHKRNSYISDATFTAYLMDRQSIPVHYNPTLLLRVDPDKTDGLTRAAFWIASSLRWHKLYREGNLKPEVFRFGKPSHYSRSEWFQDLVASSPESMAAKVMLFGSNFHAFPLDMSQYDSLFNTTRIPHKGMDEIVRHGFNPHIIVNFRSHQFRVDVADPNTGEPLPEAVIYARLSAVANSGVSVAKHDMGLLTADTRNEWAANREHLRSMQHTRNRDTLRTIDTALFVLNLDLDTDLFMTTAEDSRRSVMHMLAAPHNRWWDKSVSVIVSRNGTLGGNFEHSWGDGVAMLRYMVDCFNDSIGRSAKTLDRRAGVGVSPGGASPVELLPWDLPETIQSQLPRIDSQLHRTISNVDLDIALVSKFGKKDPIFKGPVKADPFLQIAIQLAWYRLKGTTVSTYEAASTAAFLKGRTECIRCPSMESRLFTNLMDRHDISASDKVTALMAAIKIQSKRAREAKMGGGVDRHLYALRQEARQYASVGHRELFEDESYKKMTSNLISTSSLYSDALGGGGFGPVSPGYGILYAASDHAVVFIVSSWTKGGPGYSSSDFAEALRKAVLDMHTLLPL